MDRQWTVAAAAALLSLENVAVICGLLFRSHTSVVLLGVLLLKFPLCRALLRLPRRRRRRPHPVGER